MTYCTAAELRAVTGTDRADDVLTPIIEQADREINLYLKARGVNGSPCEDLKSVSIMLAKAGLQEYGQPDGSFEASAGDFYTNNPTRDVEYFRRTAYKMLDNYVVQQSSLNTPRRCFVRKVN